MFVVRSLPLGSAATVTSVSNLPEGQIIITVETLQEYKTKNKLLQNQMF